MRFNSRLLGALAFLVGLALVGWIVRATSADRHWRAYNSAGDGAYSRGHYDYAERIYDQALQEAENLGRRELMAASLMDLSRTYAAQRRPEEARAAAEEARRAGQR